MFAFRYKSPLVPIFLFKTPNSFTLNFWFCFVFCGTFNVIFLCIVFISIFPPNNAVFKGKSKYLVKVSPSLVYSGLCATLTFRIKSPF